MRPPALACLLPLLVLPAPAAAQAMLALKPAPVRTGPPLRVSPLSGREAALSAKECRRVALAGRWMVGPGTPARGVDGTVVFAYGAALPSVLCAPMPACSLRLEPGETIAQIDLGDPVRWKVTSADIGSGAAPTSAVEVKPSDSGLTTNMTVATDCCLYVVQMVSWTKDRMPVAAFAYTEDERAVWGAYGAVRERGAEAADGLGGLGFAVADAGAESVARAEALRYGVGPLDGGLLVRFELCGAAAGRWYACSRRGALSAGSPFAVREAPAG